MFKGNCLTVRLMICIALGFASAGWAHGEERDYHFEGSISREVLENYLSRAVTHAGLLSSHSDPTTTCRKDDIRMLANIGAKFIGRAAFAWHVPPNDDAHFQEVERAARQVHEVDPEIILQAAIFENITPQVNNVAVPGWVFEEFGLQLEARNFRYEAMLFADDHFVDHFAPGNSVPDMTRLETRMWFFYRAKRYIDAGCEAIHFGQVLLMDDRDPDHRHWQNMLGRVRAYAAENARRKLVLCDAHTHGIVVGENKLLFDFHSYPCRRTGPKGTLGEGYRPIYGKSKGGLTPSGWTCESAPYLVEVDNWSAPDDEITWFAKQEEAFRNQWLRYAWNWVREHDENGWFQMPTRRILADEVNGTYMYHANRASEACPTGFNQEATIRDIWQGGE